MNINTSQYLNVRGAEANSVLNSLIQQINEEEKQRNSTLRDNLKGRFWIELVGNILAGEKLETGPSGSIDFSDAARYLMDNKLYEEGIDVLDYAANDLGKNRNFSYNFRFIEADMGTPPLEGTKISDEFFKKYAWIIEKSRDDQL